MKKRFLELEKARLKHYGFKRLVWRIFGVIGHAFFRRFPPNVSTKDGKKFLKNIKPDDDSDSDGKILKDMF